LSWSGRARVTLSGQSGEIQLNFWRWIVLAGQMLLQVSLRDIGRVTDI
jgi:hypothetical protein